MTEKPAGDSPWRQRLRLFVFGLASVPLAVAAIFCALAWLYAYVVTHPGCQGQLESLAAFGYPAEAVAFTSRDGTSLRGWYSPGLQHPETVIIVLYGHGGNSGPALPDARILAEAGYSTLVYEHRSCADPRLMASTGPYEARDVLGAVDYLRQRGDVTHIGAMGFSASGTAVLLAAADEPAIEAVLPMGGYASLADDALDASSDDQPIGERIFRRLALWALAAQIGPAEIARSPVSQIANISPRHLLLIYGEHEAAVGKQLMAAAGPPSDLWIVPGAGHGNYRLFAPDEYPRRVVEFFDAAFYP